MFTAYFFTKFYSFSVYLLPTSVLKYKNGICRQKESDLKQLTADNYSTC